MDGVQKGRLKCQGPENLKQEVGLKHKNRINHNKSNNKVPVSQHTSCRSLATPHHESWSNMPAKQEQEPQDAAHPEP